MNQAQRFHPDPFPTVKEYRAQGKWSAEVPITFSDEGIHPDTLAMMLKMGNEAEADRREQAVKAATEAGVGLRIDVLDWSTEYFLDPAVPVGTIHQRNVYPERLSPGSRGTDE